MSAVRGPPSFHMHCIEKWVVQNPTNPQCPMCRQAWELKTFARGAPATPYEDS